MKSLYKHCLPKIPFKITNSAGKTGLVTPQSTWLDIFTYVPVKFLPSLFLSILVFQIKNVLKKSRKLESLHNLVFYLSIQTLFKQNCLMNDFLLKIEKNL